jgi:hypothetical protein
MARGEKGWKKGCRKLNIFDKKICFRHFTPLSIVEKGEWIA